MQTAQELIREAKEIKKREKITYDDIMNKLTVNGSPAVSLTTLRRVFATGSEDRASGFNFEATLLPVYKAVTDLGSRTESPYAKENEFMMEQMRKKDEAIAEKDILIARLMDRLDKKDNIIEQFIVDLRQKDVLIRQLMEHNK